MQKRVWESVLQSIRIDSKLTLELTYKYETKKHPKRGAFCV
ncbi:hypothetical protein [Perlabentimonas gracilis]|nr:hypothetical protein [Perlabentimonas gracilis]